MEKVKVIVVDDHALVRQGLRRLLELEPDIQIVAEAANGGDVVELAMALVPDVVVLDLNLPGQNGIKVTQDLKAAVPGLGVVILTVHDDPQVLAAALRAGASGFCLKGDDPGEVVQAIRRAAAGGRYLPPGMADPTAVHGPPLTPREVEILAMISRGLSNREIGQALFISENTVRNHLSHIFEKLGVQDRTQAAVCAVKMGIVTRLIDRAN